MNSPKDIIEKALLDNAKDAGEMAKIIINSLARAGYAIARRSAIPAIPAIPVPGPRAIPRSGEDLKQRLVEEIEATTAARTEDLIRNMRTARGGLR
jgi:hypothetical protein